MLYFLCTTVIVILFMGLIPNLAVLFAIIWGTLLIIAGIAIKKNQLLILFLVNLGTLLIIAGSSNFIFYLAFFGLPALIVAILTAYGKEYYELQKWGIIFSVLGVSLFLLASYLITGGIGINEFEQSMHAATQESINVYKEIGLFDTYGQISQGELEDSLEHTIAGIARHLPAIYYVRGIIAVFLMIFFASHITLKRNIPRLKRKPFSREVMPWQLVWLVILGIGLWIWGRDELNNAYYAGSNILVVIVPIAVYYGIAALTYRVKQMEQSKRIWWISGLIFISFIFLPSAIIFLSMLGLFDALINLRKLPAEQEG